MDVEEVRAPGQGRMPGGELRGRFEDPWLINMRRLTALFALVYGYLEVALPAGGIAGSGRSRLLTLLAGRVW